MGRYHARLYHQMPDVELVGLVDHHPDNIRDFAQEIDVPVFHSVDEVPDIDAVSLCVPTSLHAEIAMSLLSRGIHCLIEKPVVSHAQEISKLQKAAQQGKANVVVGHVERFNPVWNYITNFIGNQKIQAIHIQRMGPASQRIKDADVIIDLLTHDFDLLYALLGTQPTDMAMQECHVTDYGPDHVQVLCHYPTGQDQVLVNLVASRITQRKMREWHLVGEFGCVVADFDRKQVEILTQERQGESQIVTFPHTNPLQDELSHFIRCIQGHEKSVVDIETAHKSLETIWTLQKQIKKARIAA